MRKRHINPSSTIAGSIFCAAIAFVPAIHGVETSTKPQALPPASATQIVYDAKNAEYNLRLRGAKDTKDGVRLLCRSGRFTSGDVPEVQERLGSFLDVSQLKLSNDTISGRFSVQTGDRPGYAITATIQDGKVSGTYTDDKGTKGEISGKLSFPIASQENISWFETARLGIGMHWSISSVKYCSNSPSWPMQANGGKPGVPKELYEGQMKDFKAQNFNPTAWAKLFKEAGAQYFIPYVKHHDGFCMWDTSTHDYKVTKTPCSRDVIGELYAACHAVDLRTGIRFSQADWHIMPLDMWPSGAKYVAQAAGMDLAQLAQHFGKDGADTANLTVKLGKESITKEMLDRIIVHRKVWEEYRPVMMKQYEELMTKYGRMDLIGGDGGYPVDADEQIEMAQKFRQWSPNILFGARVFFNCPVKFDTPVFEWGSERPKPGEPVYRIGAKVPEVWMSYTGWGAGPRRGDTSKTTLDLVTDKDVEEKGPEAVGLLVRCAALSWNLLLDVSPHDTGDLSTINVIHLRAIAKFMKNNSESITGTWGGPYAPCWLKNFKGIPGKDNKGFVWGSTRKKDRIFLHVTDWNGSETIQLPPLPTQKILDCSLLTTGEKVTFVQNDTGISVTLPAAKRQWVDTVIVLKIDSSAEDMDIIPVPVVEENTTKN